MPKTYGIGTSRLMAAIVEQHHDDAGIIWPGTVAPADIEILTVGETKDELVEAAGSLSRRLRERDLEVLWDDRAISPGVKFNDADLVGIPIQVVIGKLFLRDGLFDVKVRRDGSRHEVEEEGAPDAIERIREGLK